jgi:hypothetical protein
MTKFDIGTAEFYGFEKPRDSSLRVLIALRGQDVAISTYAVSATLRLPRYDVSPNGEPSPLAMTLGEAFSTSRYDAGSTGVEMQLCLWAG